ncbi:MAG: alpha-hydroxy-acid oxidizing protein [Naasia sp.]|nr:alpha-hydroxy-acid oxidizing protein [Naasia sp.]
MQRTLPKPSELRQQLVFKRIDPNRRRARLRGATDVWDLRRIAKRRTPTAVFDYVDGAAYSEHSLRRNRRGFADLEFAPGVLRDVSAVDLSSPLLGSTMRMPVGIAPTGLTRLTHSEGEIAGVRAAQRFGIPFTLSTMGTTSIERVADEAPTAHRWFQLYLWKDRERSLELVQRAAAAGYQALIITVDTPAAGARLRDVRNGMSMPPTLSLKTILDASYRPEWWFNYLTTESLRFANFDGSKKTLSEQVNSMFDATLDFDDLDWLRQNWAGALIVKGVQTPEDAVRVFARGADAIVVSNHGGRQLDRAPVPLHSLSSIRAAVGPEAIVILDSGIMCGGDVVAALAAGADFTLIGRAYLYGLMAGGEQGVERVLELFRNEIKLVMQLLGVTSPAQLTPDHVRLFPTRQDRA